MVNGCDGAAQGLSVESCPTRRSPTSFMHPGWDHDSNVNAYEIGRPMQRPPVLENSSSRSRTACIRTYRSKCAPGASLGCDRTQDLSGRLEPRRLSASDGVLDVPHHSVPCHHHKLREKADHHDSIRTWA